MTGSTIALLVASVVVRVVGIACNCIIPTSTRYHLHQQMQPSSTAADVQTILGTTVNSCMAKCIENYDCESAYYQVM